MDLRKIIKPTIILDESKCRANIRRMAAKARLSGVVFRPHFKTHQSAEIGSWFREEGVNSITVSSVTMAMHFASEGWKDITIAFPCNLREVDEMEKLSESVSLNILISDHDQAIFLRNRTKFKAGYFIKIDTGYKRSGIEWNDHSHIMRIVDEMNHNPSIRLMGYLTHAGHTYKAGSVTDIIDIYNDTLNKMTSLRSLTPGLKVISAGDTPSCSVIENFEGIDEIRPGNFIFYDLMQNSLGSCNTESIAISLACPVVEKNYRRNEIIIYGGGVHLSKESLTTKEGRVIYGKAVIFDKNCWTPLSGNDFVTSLSQEHGIIKASEELFKNIKTGDLLGIIPVHSCMTVDLLRQYRTFDDRTISCFSPKL